jgi:hypothetical protein
VLAATAVELHRRGLVRYMAKPVYRILLKVGLISRIELQVNKVLNACDPVPTMVIHTDVEPLEEYGLTRGDIWAPIWAVCLARWFHLEAHLSHSEAAARIEELKNDAQGIEAILTVMALGKSAFGRSLARKALERRDAWGVSPTASVPPP